VAEAGIAESAAERLVDQPSLLVALAASDPVAAAVSGHQEGCFQNDSTVLLARGTRAGCRRRPLAVPQVAQGLADVVTALAEANVDTLLIGDPGDAEAWIGEIAVDREGCRLSGSRTAGSSGRSGERQWD
jgi:hypothetical protein